MRAKDIAALAGCTRRKANYFLQGQGFGRINAVLLEHKTGINRLFWLYPLEFDLDGKAKKKISQDSKKPEDI